MRRVLTIGGADPTGGAGIQADLKTFQAHGVYGLSVITAITAQDAVGVQGVWPVSYGAVAEQLSVLASRFRIHAVKTGMVWNDRVVGVVSALIEEHALRPLVVDPLLAAHGGTRLSSPRLPHALRKYLFPLADIITPNVFEAEVLTGVTLSHERDVREAAHMLATLGAGAVLITGWRTGSKVVDWLYSEDELVPLEGGFIRRRSMHGTGCILSAAIAANFAQGVGLRNAVEAAREYVKKEIMHSLPFWGRRRVARHG